MAEPTPERQVLESGWPRPSSMKEPGSSSHRGVSYSRSVAAAVTRVGVGASHLSDRNDHGGRSSCSSGLRPRPARATPAASSTRASSTEAVRSAWSVPRLLAARASTSYGGASGGVSVRPAQLVRRAPPERPAPVPPVMTERWVLRSPRSRRGHRFRRSGVWGNGADRPDGSSWSDRSRGFGFQLWRDRCCRACWRNRSKRCCRSSTGPDVGIS